MSADDLDMTQPFSSSLAFPADSATLDGTSRIRADQLFSPHGDLGAPAALKNYSPNTNQGVSARLLSDSPNEMATDQLNSFLDTRSSSRVLPAFDSQVRQRPDDSAQHSMGELEVAQPAPVAGSHPQTVPGPMNPTVSSVPALHHNLEQGSYFGPTSPLHLSSPPDQPQLRCEEPVIPGITLDSDSGQLRSLLLRSYFNYQDLWLPVVHQENFMAHRAIGKRSQWYSTFLESVLLAYGARSSTSSAIRALRDKYFERAKADMVHELEDVTAASLQGFLLLSEYDVTQGHEKEGWILCGIACRMISELGLHEVKVEPSESSEQANPTENSLRYKLICCCRVYEGVWCLYMGRPSSVPPWTTDPRAQLRTSRTGGKVSMLDVWVDLCDPVAEITNILNTSSRSDPKAAARLSELNAQLLTWHDNLPPEASCNESRLSDLNSSAYALIMQFCKVQILLHSPSVVAFSRQTGFNDSEASLLPGWTAEESWKVAHENAVRIARLLLTYRQIFGVESISSIMVDHVSLAATALALFLSPRPDPHITNERDVEWLRLLIDTMEVLGVHFPITKRMLRSLLLMVEGSPLARLFSTQHTGSSQGSPVKLVEPSFWESFDGGTNPSFFASQGYNFDGGPGEGDRGWMMQQEQPPQQEQPAMSTSSW